MSLTGSEGVRVIPEEILERWQSIANMMAEVIEVSYAVISKIDPPRYEILMVNDDNPKGLKTGDGFALADTYCQTVFSEHKKLVIPNALKDRLWLDHPEVKAGFISYLGFPILLPNGTVFGTICILDTKEKCYSNKVESLLWLFKDQIENHLALLFHQAELERKVKERTREVTETNKRLMQVIRERKRAYSLLQESQNRFRSLVENSLVGIAIARENRIVYQNPEHRRILGLLPDEVGFPYSENVHDEDVDRVKQAAGEFLRGDTNSFNETFSIYPFGAKKRPRNLKWVQCRAIRIKYGKQEAVLATMTDITRTKELEKLVLIEDKMSTLGRVAAGVAHEIRSPLSAINMNLHALQEAFPFAKVSDDEKVRVVNEMSEKIREASQHIEAIVKNISDFARPSLPHFTIADLNRCIEKAIDLSAAWVRTNGIRLEAALSPDVPSCRIDSQMIEEVLLNLIINAVDALQKVAGVRRLMISSEAQDDAIQIRVADSGPGVSEEIRDGIFDPFFTTKTDGIGIGLALASRIVADHGGSLTLERSQWGGAEFMISIPKMTQL